MTTMLDKYFQPYDMLKELSILFGVIEDDVYISDYSPLTQENSLIYAAIQECGPDFPSALDLFVAKSVSNADNVVITQLLCRHLNCRALIQAKYPEIDYIDDAVRWLIEPNGHIYRVVMQLQPLEEEDRYVINYNYEIQPIVWPETDTLSQY